MLKREYPKKAFFRLLATTDPLSQRQNTEKLI